MVVWKMSTEVKPEPEGLKLNLGSGRRVILGWINVDIHPLIPISKIPGATWLLFKFGVIGEGAYRMKWPKNTLWHDIRKGLPYDDNTADYMYASHFFEHVKEEEAEKILRECHRVLRPGGVLRIVIPDLELLAKKYVAGDKAFFEKIKPGRHITGAFLDLLNFYPSKLSRRVISGQHHLWMHDFSSLSALLQKVGFGKIERKQFRETKIPDIPSFEVEIPFNLYVEAQK